MFSTGMPQKLAVSGCGFVTRYQNTSNLENHYIRAGTDHTELADRLTTMQDTDSQDSLGSVADGSIGLSPTCVAPAFTDEKEYHCDIKFVNQVACSKKWSSVDVQERC